MRRSFDCQVPLCAPQLLNAWIWLAVAVFMTGWWFSGSVQATDALVSGNYKSWQLAAPTIHQRSAYRQDLASGTIGDPVVFDQVVRWKLSELTREDNLPEVAKLRRQLRNDLSLAGRADDRAAHRRILQLVLEHLPPIVEDRGYHAGVRYNAVLLLGELNEVEERPFQFGAQAQPLAEAIPMLLNWLDPPADARTEDAIQLGALLGVLRHAQLGMADEGLRQRGLEAALNMAGEYETPLHRTSDGHQWLRRRAIHLLARLARPGATPEDNRAVELIWQAIDDPRGSLNLQVESALAYSLLAPRLPADRLDVAQLVRKLSSLAGRTVRSELRETGAAPPAFTQWQSRRIIAARLGMLTHACRQLGVDTAALRHSPTPAEVNSLADLYLGLKSWIGLATDPQLPSHRAADALAQALPLLDRPVAAEKP